MQLLVNQEFIHNFIGIARRTAHKYTVKRLLTSGTSNAKALRNRCARQQGGGNEGGRGGEKERKETRVRKEERKRGR